MQLISIWQKYQHQQTAIRSDYKTWITTQERVSHHAWKDCSQLSRTSIISSISVDFNLVFSWKVLDSPWTRPCYFGNENSQRRLILTSSRKTIRTMWDICSVKRVSVMTINPGTVLRLSISKHPVLVSIMDVHSKHLVKKTCVNFCLLTDLQPVTWTSLLTRSVRVFSKWHVSDYSSFLTKMQLVKM